MAENWFQKEIEREQPHTVAELAPDVVYRVPHCPDVTVRRALVHAYGEFCRRSSCLRHFNVHDIREGVADYPVVTWCDGYVDSVQRVWTDFSLLREGADYRVLDGDVTVVRLARVPAGVARLRIDFTEAPAYGSDRVPTWFLERHGSAVVSGALSELYAMQNMPWYRPDVAAAERKAFQDAIGTAKMRAVSGANAGSGRVSAPDFSTIIL